jgi:transaldolase
MGGRLMEFFIDTANIEQIKEAMSWGILDGVTTNPTLVSREGKKFEDVARVIFKIVKGPISVEVVSEKADGMVKEAEKLGKLGPQAVIKIPMTTEGMKAVKILSKKGVKTNVTLVFSANQALIAAKAGATYVSPFIGRLEDIGQNGMQIVRDIKQIFENYGFKTKIIVASVRGPKHVIEAAKIGADVCTVPSAVLKKMFKHPLTDAGLKSFLADWEKVKKK